MPHPRVTSCVVCNRPTSEVGSLSARKRCWDCGIGAVWRNAASLAARAGPDFELWRRRTILALLNLNASPTASLDLISDETLRKLLTGQTPAEV